MTNPESPREFLASITAEELLDILEQTERTTIESGAAEPDSTDLIHIQVTELRNHYPGIHEYILEKVRDLRDNSDQDDDKSYAVGYFAGAILLARAITLTTEARELPEL